MRNSSAGLLLFPSSFPFLLKARKRREMGWGQQRDFLLSLGWLALRRINDSGRWAAGVTKLVCVGLRPRWSLSNWNHFPLTSPVSRELVALSANKGAEEVGGNPGWAAELRARRIHLPGRPHLHRLRRLGLSRRQGPASAERTHWVPSWC